MRAKRGCGQHVFFPLQSCSDPIISSLGMLLLKWDNDIKYLKASSLSIVCCTYFVTVGMYLTELENVNNVKNPILCFPASLTFDRVEIIDQSHYLSLSWVFAGTEPLVSRENSTVRLAMRLVAHHSLDITLICLSHLRRKRSFLQTRLN